MSKASRNGGTADASMQRHARINLLAQLGGPQTNWPHLFVEVHQLPEISNAEILAAQGTRINLSAQGACAGGSISGANKEGSEESILQHSEELA